jgi:hypothetical protein
LINKADIEAARGDRSLGARTGSFQIMLHAHAAEKLPQLLDLGSRAAAEIADVRSQCGKACLVHTKDAGQAGVCGLPSAPFDPIAGAIASVAVRLFETETRAYHDIKGPFWNYEHD